MRYTKHPAAPVVVAALALSALFLIAGADTFPMDDAYIHAVYARNLAETGRLTFNLDPPDPGLGTTSILWPLLLAALHPLVGVIAAARLLGLASYLAVVVLSTVVAGWMTPHDDRRTATVAGLLVALSGNLLWFSHSGMETMLWLAFGLGALVAWRARRHLHCGLLLGLMMLTRIEGFVLLGVLLAAEVGSRTSAGRLDRSNRSAFRRAGLTAGLALLLLSPWLAYVHGRTGHWLPTSYSGKKHAQVRGAVQTIKEALGERGQIELEQDRLPWWTAMIYPMGVVSYGYGFVAGGAYLPGPRFPLAGKLGEITGGLSLTALALLALVFLPLHQAAGRRALAVARAPGADRRRWALLALAAWILLHNVAYWLKLPTPGTASRYQVVNHLAWWLLTGVGAWRLTANRRHAWRWAAVAVFLAAWNAGWWWTVYASDVRHMRQVRLATAAYVRDSTPPGAVVAAHDIGALGWLMERRIIDLGGLIDPGWLAAAKAGRQAEFLREQGADYLILPTKHSSERTAFFDYADFLGLKENPKAPYQPVQSFENDYDDWARGATPTWNALPAVTVYRFDWSRR